jgi:hypothetical protein
VRARGAKLWGAKRETKKTKTKRIKVVSYVVVQRERKERSDFKIKRFFFFLEKET